MSRSVPLANRSSESLKGQHVTEGRYGRCPSPSASRETGLRSGQGAHIVSAGNSARSENKNCLDSSGKRSSFYLTSSMACVPTVCIVSLLWQRTAGVSKPCFLMGRCWSLGLMNVSKGAADSLSHSEPLFSLASHPIPRLCLQLRKF